MERYQLSLDCFKPNKQIDILGALWSTDCSYLSTPSSHGGGLSVTWDQTGDCVGPPTAAGAAPAPRLLQGKLPAFAHSIEGEKQEIG